MAQYLIYKDPGSELESLRSGVRDYSYVEDKILTVIGFNGDEDTDWENIKTITPEFYSLFPTDLVITVISGTELQLDWLNFDALSTSIRIERTAVAGGGSGWTEIVSLGGTINHYHDTGLTPGTLYYYRIRVERTNRYSAYSSVISETPYEPEVVLYKTGLTTPLSSGQLTKLNTFVASLKSGLNITALSQVFDVMYVLGGETQESSLKNLVRNAHHCTVGAGSLGFVAYEGVHNAGSCYLKSHYNILTDSVNTTDDNVALGVYSRTTNGGYSATVRTVDFRLGLYIGYSNNSYPLMAPLSGNGVYALFQDQENRGLHILERWGYWYGMARNGYVLRVDGAAAWGRSSSELQILGFEGDTTCNEQLSFVFVSRNMTEEESIVVSTAFEAYMDSNSKGVITYLDGNPSLLTSVSLTDTTIKLDWTIGSTNHDGHVIERSADGTTGWGIVGTTSGSTATFTDTGLTAATRYYYRVRAYKTIIAFSQPTNVVNAYTDGTEMIDQANWAKAAYWDYIGGNFVANDTSIVSSNSFDMMRKNMLFTPGLKYRFTATFIVTSGTGNVSASNNGVWTTVSGTFTTTNIVVETGYHLLINGFGSTFEVTAMSVRRYYN